MAVLLLFVPPVASAQQLGGIPETEDEQYWAFHDSAAALFARAMYPVALQEIDEALLLRPGDPDATALRESIVAAMNPPAAHPEAKQRAGAPESEPIAADAGAQHIPQPIDLTEAALALAPDSEGWRAFVLAYVEGRSP